MLGLDPGLRRAGGSGAAAPGPGAPRWGAPDAIRSLDATLEQVDDWYLGQVIDRHAGNLSRASRALGVDRSTLRRWVARDRGLPTKDRLDR